MSTTSPASPGTATTPPALLRTNGVAAAAAPPGRVWTISTEAGHRASGYLPGWAENDPSATDVPVARLPVELADICHQEEFSAHLLPVSRAGESPRAEAVLAAYITCHPFAHDPLPRCPVAQLQLVDDFWITDLDPVGVTEVAAAFRAFADRLMTEVAPKLAAYSSDWTAHHAAPLEAAQGPGGP